MDPNQALQSVRELGRQIREDHTKSRASLGLALAEHLLTLDEWLSKGGFLPEPWRGRQDALGSDPGLAAPLEFALHAPDMKSAWEGAHEMCRSYFGDVAYVLRADKAGLYDGQRGAAGELLAASFNVQFYAYVEQVITDA
jgi:hypothetical protein